MFTPVANHPAAATKSRRCCPIRLRHCGHLPSARGGNLWLLPQILANRREWVLLAPRSTPSPVRYRSHFEPHCRPLARKTRARSRRDANPVCNRLGGGPVAGGYLWRAQLQGKLMVAAGCTPCHHPAWEMAREAGKVCEFKPVPLSLTWLKQNQGAILKPDCRRRTVHQDLVTDGVRDISSIVFSFCPSWRDAADDRAYWGDEHVFGIAMMVEMIPPGPWQTGWRASILPFRLSRWQSRSHHV